MSNIVSANRLLFFKAEKYHYSNEHSFDTSLCPRPHFCMGLVLRGQGIFTDCSCGENILVEPGDIIFVPMGSTYISHWTGAPDVCYISAHFIFDRQSIFSEHKNFSLQKVRLQDADRATEEFSKMFAQYSGDEAQQLGALGTFYGILEQVLPLLKIYKTHSTDPRLQKATEFIEQNFAQNITVEQLASCCQMSVPRFYPKFKKQFGATPIEYINQYRITRSIVLLMNSNLTVENISEQVGFESAAYFRRVFKKTTGFSPREFRKTAIEL